MYIDFSYVDFFISRWQKFDFIDGTKNVALILCFSPYLYDSKVAPSTSVHPQLSLGGFFPQGVVDATIYHRNVGHHGCQKGAILKGSILLT